MTTVQQYKESLQKVFKSDFCGFDIFIKEVLCPLFKEIEFLEEGDLLLRSEYAKYHNNGLRQAKKVAQIRDMFDVIDVYEITLDDKIDLAKSKVHIQSFVRSEAQVFAHAFILFHYENVENCEWRFSYMYKEGTIKSATSAKRFTYLFGQNVSCRTAVERFAILFDKKIEKKDILDAFSVEALSAEFFKGYKAHYEDFCQYLYANCTDANKFGELFGRCGEKALRDYVKKMLGRLVFIQFLHRKRWAPNLLVAYNNHPELQDNFLDAYLEPLFGGILNTPKDHRLNEFRLNVKRGWDESLIKEFESVPYLNGGLFESDIQDPPRSRFPKEYFCNLFQFFEQYNFTIDENESDDAEIGIDPEMLGKIFENLLEDNKDKGAFYTPKEIVQYMCRESLVQYLENHIDKKYHSAVENLIRWRKVDLSLQPKEIAQNIYSLLENIKICDPAIGSGVFPMGMLSELYNARLLMYGFTKPKKDFVHFDVKKSIIENNIYGVDIERGAIDIARLRFWLSLLIAEKEPVPLPNFDYKFMRGNSLIESFEGVDLSNIYNSMQTNQQVKIIFDDESLAEESFERNMKEYFHTNDSGQKSIIRQKIDNAVKALVKAKTNGNKVLHTMLDGISCSDTDKFFLWHTWFSDVFEKGGFDIVIGNPPYINVQLMTIFEKESYKKIYSVFIKRCDIFALFVELGLLHIASNKGVVSFIIPSVVHSNMSYTKLRDMILNNHWLTEVCYTGGDVFNAPTVDTTILLCNKMGCQSIVLKDATKDLDNPRAHIVPVDYFRQFNNVISVGGNDEANSIFAKLLNPELEKLDAHFAVFQGIVTGNNTAFIFENEKEALEKGVDKSLLHPLCHGRDIEKYMVRSRDRRLLYIDNSVNIDLFPQTHRWLNGFYEQLSNRREAKKRTIQWYGLQWPREKSELDIKEKILLQNTRNESLKTRIVATIDSESIYGTQGLNFIIPKAKDANLHFLLGILNSKLMNFLFATKFLNLAIKAEYVKQLRLPLADNSQQKSIITLVDQVIAAKKQYPQADTSEIEREIDKLVYQLYGLSDEEVEIVESKKE